MSKNNFVVWPESWPKYYNGGQLCDMLVGTCSCGAWHQDGEFSLSFCDVLYRYDKPVATGDTRLKPDWNKGSQMKDVTVLKRIWLSDPAYYVYRPILKDKCFVDLKALEKYIMDESFNIGEDFPSHRHTNKRGDVFLVITPEWCKILYLVKADFKPQWSEWGGESIEV